MILTINSCNQDLLDIPQRGVINTDEYYENASDADARALIAYIYKQIYQETGIGWVSMWPGLSNDIPASGGIYSNDNVNPQTHSGNGLFTSLYRINYLCNMIIEKMNEDTEEKKTVKGEAYFWRAWANMYLTQIWGTPPLVDHVLTSEELKSPNGDPAALWNYVETSLQEAINRLPSKPEIDGQRQIGGRVTKHSAYTLLGKAQLWQGDYAAAISSLETVINSNLYGLIDNYVDLYRPHSDFCKEYVWEWNIEDSDQPNYNLEQDRRTLQLGWRLDFVQMPGGIHIGFGGASNYTKNFYDFMIARGEKGKNRYNGTVWDYEDVLDRFIALGEAATRTEAIGKFWKQGVLSGSEGYMRGKMNTYREDLFIYSADQDIFSKANWPGMRYSEVLLNYAEACALSGQKTSEGLAALNTVRTRAGLDALLSLNLQDVKDEKRAELVLEGDRYLDLIRWGDAAKELAGRGAFTYIFLGYKAGTNPENGNPDDYNIDTQPYAGIVQDFVVGRDEHFPFPYNEMHQNENLVQNPNW
jgi:hypothetical protein